MVANSARGQLNRKNDSFPIPFHARDFDRPRQAQPFRSASTCLFSTLKLILALSHEFLSIFLLSTMASIHTVNHDRCNIEFFDARNCVSMAFTDKSPPAQVQPSLGSFE